jgi:CheY-like chemotaxis protein
VVENDADTQILACLALEKLGKLVVAAAGSGREALVRAPAFRPDLILMDVMMPGGDGPATLAALRRQGSTARTPVVFLTGKVEPQDLAAYVELGVLGVVAKPFTPETLPRRLMELWNGRRARSGSGDPALDYGRLRRRFAAGLPEKIRAIEDAVLKLDVESVHDLAHSLVGVARTFEYEDVARVAEALVTLTRKASPEGGPLLVQRLHAAARAGKRSRKR